PTSSRSPPAPLPTATATACPTWSARRWPAASRSSGRPSAGYRRCSSTARRASSSPRATPRPSRSPSRAWRATPASASGWERARGALSAGQGDEGIGPALSFVATATAVLHAGATRVQADVEPDTGNLGPEGDRAAATPRTRAVIPVHLYGQPADVEAIRSALPR